MTAHDGVGQIGNSSRDGIDAYAVRAEGTGSRLHVRVSFEGPRLVARALALGDLVMMRKQLITVKSLAEPEAAAIR